MVNCEREWYDGRGLEGEASLNVIDSIRLSIKMNRTSNQTKQIEIELRTLLTFLCFFEQVLCFFERVFIAAGGRASLFFFSGKNERISKFRIFRN